LCEPYIVLPGKLGPIIEFRHELDKVVIPLDKICLYVLDCPGCHDVGLCPGYDLMFTEMPDNFGLEIFDSKGTSIIREMNGKRSKRLKLRTREDETYFIVISPGSKTAIGKKYEIPLKVGMLPE
jgi:hypothetical protein